MGNQRVLALSEENLARRVRQERQRRSWSQARLSTELAAHGTHVAQSSIAKLERTGGDRRPVTVDEAVALARVFDLSLEELLVAPEAYEDVAIRARYEALDVALARAGEANVAVKTQLKELIDMLSGDEAALRGLARLTASHGYYDPSTFIAAGLDVDVVRNIDAGISTVLWDAL